MVKDEAARIIGRRADDLVGVVNMRSAPEPQDVQAAKAVQVAYARAVHQSHIPCIHVTEANPRAAPDLPAEGAAVERLLYRLGQDDRKQK
jgi:hypothetical protein